MAALVSMREAYGKALVAVGRANDKVVALSADVSNSDFSFMFQEAFPHRFFNVGIAEQSLVDVAAGFAKAGLIPFANTFAFLFATRAVEMVRTHLCYGHANVKLMGAYAGLSDSFDGPTHNSISDLSILRSLPGMTIVVPSDPVAVAKLLPKIADWDGPVYCRLNRNEVPVLFGDSYEPQIGKAMVHRAGKDLSIISAGLMVSRSLAAAEQLQSEGISARVVEMHTIKPLDRQAILAAAEETGAIVTAEGRPVPVLRVGIDDRFAESGPYDAILEAYGMGVSHVVSAARAAVAAKRGKGR